MEDVVVRDQLRSPPAEGDGFEVRLEELEVAGEGATDLVLGQKMLASANVLGDAGEQLAAQFIDIALLAVLRRKGFDEREVLFPPQLQRLQKAAMGLGDAGITLDQFREGAAVGHDRGEV